MYEFFESQDFLSAVKSNDCFLFRNLDLPIVTWDDVIRCINDSVNQGLCHFVGKPHKLGLILRRAQLIKQVEPVMLAFNNVMPDLQVSGHVYVSLSNVSGTLGRHRSKSSVFFWQAIGSTQWTVTREKGDETFVINKNDAIYCPSGMYHDVVPLSPRVGISLGLDHLYKK